MSSDSTRFEGVVSFRPEPCPICGEPRTNNLTSHCVMCDWHLSWLKKHKDSERLQKMFKEIMR